MCRSGKASGGGHAAVGAGRWGRRLVEAGPVAGGRAADARGPIGLVGVERLGREQRLDEALQARAVLGERLAGSFVALLEEPADLGVDQLARGGGRLVPVEANVGCWPGPGSTDTGPTAADIPHRPTICRARRVACSRSLSAPVVTSP